MKDWVPPKGMHWNKPDEQGHILGAPVGLCVATCRIELRDNGRYDLYHGGITEELRKVASNKKNLGNVKLLAHLINFDELPTTKE
jgi:hypothetical protein